MIPNGNWSNSLPNITRFCLLLIPEHRRKKDNFSFLDFINEHFQCFVKLLFLPLGLLACFHDPVVLRNPTLFTLICIYFLKFRTDWDVQNKCAWIQPCTQFHTSERYFFGFDRTPVFCMKFTQVSNVREAPGQVVTTWLSVFTLMKCSPQIIICFFQDDFSFHFQSWGHFFSPEAICGIPPHPPPPPLGHDFSRL